MQDLEGRIAVLTGGACGIGSVLSLPLSYQLSADNEMSCEIARALVVHGCRVVMVNSREKQCTETITQIRDEVGDDIAQIEWRYCDMTNLIQVQEVFSALCDELPRLDLCIFGSGIDMVHFETDLHCIDAYFGMMWLGHFYASNLLWPLLRKTSRVPGNAAPRVIFEAPEQQRPRCSNDGTSSDEDDAQRSAYDSEVCSEIFRRSRTSLILGVRHGLAERIVKRHHDNIYALAVQPAKSTTDADSLSRRDSHTEQQELCDRILETLAKGTKTPVRSCSRAVLYAATSPDVEQEYLNGAYLVDVVSLRPARATLKYLTNRFLSAGDFRPREGSGRGSFAGTRLLGHQRTRHQGRRRARRATHMGCLLGRIGVSDEPSSTNL